MPRPTTKDRLKETAESNFTKLFALIGSMTEEEQAMAFPFNDCDKNVRDVLAHLYEWHRPLLDWAFKKIKAHRNSLTK